MPYDAKHMHMRVSSVAAAAKQRPYGHSSILQFLATVSPAMSDQRDEFKTQGEEGEKKEKVHQVKEMIVVTDLGSTNTDDEMAAMHVLRLHMLGLAKVIGFAVTHFWAGRRAQVLALLLRTLGLEHQIPIWVDGRAWSFDRDTPLWPRSVFGVPLEYQTTEEIKAGLKEWNPVFLKYYTPLVKRAMPPLPEPDSFPDAAEEISKAIVQKKKKKEEGESEAAAPLTITLLGPVQVMVDALLLCKNGGGGGGGGSGGRSDGSPPRITRPLRIVAMGGGFNGPEVEAVSNSPVPAEKMGYNWGIAPESTRTFLQLCKEIGVLPLVVSSSLIRAGPFNMDERHHAAMRDLVSQHEKRDASGDSAEAATAARARGIFLEAFLNQWWKNDEYRVLPHAEDLAKERFRATQLATTGATTAPGAPAGASLMPSVPSDKASSVSVLSMTCPVKILADPLTMIVATESSPAPVPTILARVTMKPPVVLNTMKSYLDVPKGEDGKATTPWDTEEVDSPEKANVELVTHLPSTGKGLAPALANAVANQLTQSVLALFHL